ncbi:hypothetical protein D6D05_09611 [Aureobasidium pullulans]|nr:hypothetical protein D6D05_09611 [Aureobasidium pullulans]
MVNSVISSSFIKKIVSKAGSEVNIKYATQTSTWKRFSLSPIIQQKFVEAVKKSDIPATATTVVLVETEHPSQKDSYPHYTAICLDKDEKHLTTKHLYP